MSVTLLVYVLLFFFLIFFYSSTFNVLKTMFGLVVGCVVGFCRLGPLQIFELFKVHQTLDL